MTDMYLSSPEDIKKALALWNPLTPLAPIRETDSAEVQELGKRLGGRGAYAHEIAQMVATLCSPDSGWCTGSQGVKQHNNKSTQYNTTPYHIAKIKPTQLIQYRDF